MNKIEIKKMMRNILIGVIALVAITALGFKNIASLLIGILAINVILFIHELGHFLVAKAVNMPVYEFSVGVGPKIYSKMVNSVEYCIRCIPLGGYVVFEKIEEENDEEECTPANDSIDDYRNIHPLKRVAVILAGPIFNFLLAFIIIVGLYMGEGFATTTIGSIIEKSPAQDYGLQVGDSIVSINDITINSWNDIVVITSQNEDLSFKVNRNGKTEIIDVKSRLDDETNSYKIGISPQYKKDIFKSISNGAKTTIYNIKASFDGYVKIIKDTFAKKEDSNVELVGPIGTIQTISESARYGFSSLLIMVFSMSISVGIFNLIPIIPNLDGGRLLFVLIEILRGGKQFSRKTEENILVTGAYLLIGLFLFVTFKDLTSLF